MSLAYANFLPQALAGNVIVPGHTLKMALLTAAYVPNLVGHVHTSDVNAHETTGPGYIPGGAALTGVSLTGPTAANSWGQPWTAANDTLYGDVVRPAPGNGYLYMAVSNGTTGGSQPTWPTVVGVDVTDSGVTWVNIGAWITVLSSAAPSWPASTFSTAYGVIYDNSTLVLLCLMDFGGTQSPASQNFVVEPDPVCGWMIFPPL